jgi:hypothetical protein
MATETTDNEYNHKRSREQTITNPSETNIPPQRYSKKAKTEPFRDFTSILSDEIWIDIFSWLNPQDIRNINAVSKRFRQNTNEPILPAALANRIRFNPQIENSKKDESSNFMPKAEGYCTDFSNLPDETLLNIFKRLGFNDLKTIQQTSKHFRQVGNEPALWKIIATQEELEVAHIDSFGTYLFHKFLSTKTLSDKVYYEIAKTHPNVRNIRFIGFDLAFGIIDPSEASFDDSKDPSDLEPVSKIVNFHGIDATLTTNTGRQIKVDTQENIEESQVLYELAPIESYTLQDLKFSWNEFPIKITFRPISGTDKNPPIRTGLGLICRDGGPDGDEIPWFFHYYNLETVLEPGNVTRELLFGNLLSGHQESASKTVALTLASCDEYEKAGPILTWPEPLNQVRIQRNIVEEY